MKKLSSFIICLYLVASCFGQSLTVKKVDVSTFQLQSTPTIQVEGQVTNLLFNGAGDKICISHSKGKMEVFNATTGDLLWERSGATFHPHAGVGLPGTQFFVSAQHKDAGGKIKLLSWDIGQESGEIDGFMGGPTGLDHHDGKIAWAGTDGKVFEFDINSFSHVTTTGWTHHRGHATTVAYGPQGEIITGGTDGVVFKGNRDNAPEEVMYFDRMVASVAVSPSLEESDGSLTPTYVAAGDKGGALHIKNLQEDSFLLKDTLDGTCQYLMFHPTDPSLLFAATPTTLYLIDLSTKSKTNQYNSTTGITAMALREDGKGLAIGKEDGNVVFFRFDQ